MSLLISPVSGGEDRGMARGTRLSGRSWSLWVGGVM